MCGRYVLWLRAREARQQLQESNMPSQDAPSDDDVRQTYNFAPGYYGLVYRADVGDQGAGSSRHEDADGPEEANDNAEKAKGQSGRQSQEKEPSYRLQAMKWGLVPFWTKRNPDYGTMMKTINCRDDSLATSGGMWQSMKGKKRCIVLAQGFYEWLKKDGGKEKVPHYVKRKDGQMMCFAGLWDCVKYEDATDKLYSYTIITTDANHQLAFLHDRMPVILDNGSEDLFDWLDPSKSKWDAGLQSLLKPYKGELECYPVVKDVGKVGNNSPSFIVPVDSSENKQNIANFFGKQRELNAKKATRREGSDEMDDIASMGTTPKKDPGEARETKQGSGSSENNAPKPVAAGDKRAHDDAERHEEEPEQKVAKMPASPVRPTAKAPSKNSKRNRSATSNGSGSPAKGRSATRRIDGFFKPGEKAGG